MNNSDKNEFLTLMTGVGEIYNKVVTKTLLSVYFDSLKNYSLEDVKTAFSKHSVDPKHGTFFPKPADIVRHIQTNNIPVDDRAALAWMEIENAIRFEGAYGSPKLEDKQAMAAILNMGSWVDICHTHVDKMGFKRQEFISIYKSLENTPVELLASRKLIGIHDLAEQREESVKSLADIAKKITDQRK